MSIRKILSVIIILNLVLGYISTSVLTGNITKSMLKTEKESVVVSALARENGKWNGKSVQKTWNLDMINVGKYVKKNKYKEEIKVAILDSGIDPTCDLPIGEHVNLVPGEENVSVRFEDTTGHGTAVAGIVAGYDEEKGIYGTNPNVSIYSAKILDDKNEAPVERVVRAINWAIEKNVDIINMSFGTNHDSQELHNAIKRAERKNILIVAAAGNGGDVCYPAAYHEVIAVGAVTTEGEVSEESSIGEEVELVAPGEDIVTTGVYDGVTCVDGTSMAAPHVAGVAALLMSEKKEYDAKFVRYLLQHSANDLEEGNRSGYGLVDAQYALNHYKEIKKNYYNSKQESIKNEKEVKNYDVDIVEGKWSSTRHDEAINAGGAKLNYVEITLMRMGSKYADKYNLYGMRANPYFHGFYEGVTSGMVANNYVASYIFITRMAHSGIDKASVSGLQNATGYKTYSTMKSKLKDFFLKYPQVFNGEKDTEENRRYVLWGIAIHSASDVYAHSAFEKNGSSWKWIQHPNADIIKYCPQRFEAAKKVVSKIISRYIAVTTLTSTGKRVPSGSNAGNYNQFVLSDSYYTKKTIGKNEATPTKNVPYRLKNLKKFMGELGYSNLTKFNNQSC